MKSLHWGIQHNHIQFLTWYIEFKISDLTKGLLCDTETTCLISFTFCYVCFSFLKCSLFKPISVLSINTSCYICTGIVWVTVIHIFTVGSKEAKLAGTSLLFMTCASIFASVWVTCSWNPKKSIVKKKETGWHQMHFLSCELFSIQEMGISEAKLLDNRLVSSLKWRLYFLFPVSLYLMSYSLLE